MLVRDCYMKTADNVSLTIRTIIACTRFQQLAGSRFPERSKGVIANIRNASNSSHPGSPRRSWTTICSVQHEIANKGGRLREQIGLWGRVVGPSVALCWFDSIDVGLEQGVAAARPARPPRRARSAFASQYAKPVDSEASDLWVAWESPWKSHLTA